MSSLIPTNSQSPYEAAIQNVFDTFKRAFTLYIEGQVAFVSSNPNYSRFGQHDQNVFNPAVNPQATTVYGTILYANGQPWEYIEPASRANYQQDKIRNSKGVVRIKVDGSGYALMVNCKRVNLDGFDFTMVSNARPHGVFLPARYTFNLVKVD